MRTYGLKLYLVFAITFLVMHFTGVMVSSLPYILNAAITFVIVLSTLLLLMKWESGISIKNSLVFIGFQKTNLRSITPGIILTCLLLISYLFLGILLNVNITLAKNWWLNLPGLFLTGGLMEEMFFRGYFFGSLRQKMSFRKAVIQSAVFFTLAHFVLFTYMDWPLALLSTLLAVASSVPLAFLYEFGNGTVWSPAILHTAIRTIGLVVTTVEKNFMQLSLLWIIVCIVLPYIFLLLYKDFRAIWRKTNTH